MQAGDQIARTELIEHNLRLVSYIARKFNDPSYEIEDLISIGTFGLMKAIDTFNLDKGYHFATYARRCIENEMLMYFRVNKKHSNTISLGEPVAIDNKGKELLIEDTIEDPKQDFVSDYEEQELYKEVREFVEELPEREKYITKMLFGFDDKRMTQKELAEKLGIDQSWVSQMKKRILEKLSIHLRQIEKIGKLKKESTTSLENTKSPKMKILSGKNNTLKS